MTMEEKLNGYNPEFSFLRAYDFLDGIDRYAEGKEIDAIITVPKKHGFISQLFKTSHTKKLAYHSHVPTIAISIIEPLFPGVFGHAGLKKLLRIYVLLLKPFYQPSI